MRNPPWTEDELVLALAAYMRHGGNPPGKSSEEIQTLSQRLNALRRIYGTTQTTTLRNPNGAYMKIMNFRRLDPAFTKQEKAGLQRGNRLEEVVWAKYADQPTALGKAEVEIVTKLG